MRIDTLAKKIFLLAFVSIFIFVLFYSLILYYIFPISYERYLYDEITETNDEVVETITSEDYISDRESLIEYLDDVADQKAVDIKIYSINSDTNEITSVYSPNYPTLAQSNFPDIFEQVNGIDSSSTVNSEPFTINNNTYILQTSFDERNIVNIQETMKYLVPYFFVTVIVITVFISILFSLYVSRPIVKLSQKSKQFSKLDFTIDNKRYGNDEIGQLNRDLDQMGIHLKLAINKLNHDVEIANRLEFERRNQLAIMSHELKTPLTIIKGQLEMMLANVGKYKDRDFYLQESLYKVETMQGLISDILLTSDIESMDKLKDATQYDLVAEINKITNELRVLNPDININFVHDSDKNVINANPKIFNQIIKNIIENAIKYTENNQDINIDFSNHIFRVCNYNSKVTTEDLQELFEPFKRFEKSRNSSKGGHGLGLYIVQKGLSIHNFNYSFTANDSIVCFEIDFNVKEKKIEL